MFAMTLDGTLWRTVEPL